jgi:hypothetical protein
MGAFDDLAEQRIKAAMAEGCFDDLPGRGRALVLDDDSLVPEDLRLGLRVLKNAGYLPEELTLRREITGIEQLLEQALDEDGRRLAGRRLALLRMRLAICGGERAVILEDEYRARVRRRLGRDCRSELAPTKIPGS